MEKYEEKYNILQWVVCILIWSGDCNTSLTSKFCQLSFFILTFNAVNLFPSLRQIDKLKN